MRSKILGYKHTFKELDLLYEIGKSITSESKLVDLIEKITAMTQSSLNASASSLLLCDIDNQELIFEYMSGSVRKTLKQKRVSTRSGIAGWVALHGSPLIVNDVSKDPRFSKEVDDATGFKTKSIICVPMILQKKVIGVIEVLNKQDTTEFTERDLEILVSVAATAAISIDNARLQQTITDAYKSTINTLAMAVEAKDPYTHGHSRRVMEYSQLAGESLKLSPNELETLEYAAILHDIGKIAIPDGILHKSACLNTEEWEIMREHPLEGVNILKEVPFLSEANQIILHHHERYDGTGYPGGLAGEQIPLGARLMAVADSFDAMTTSRAYRAAMKVDLALEELQVCSGIQFCPLAVEAFISGFQQKSLSISYTITESPGFPKEVIE